jgi:hypothetical protein
MVQAGDWFLNIPPPNACGYGEHALPAWSGKQKFPGTERSPDSSNKSEQHWLDCS